MDFYLLKGYWSDAGTFESLFRAGELVRNKRFSNSEKLAKILKT